MSQISKTRARLNLLNYCHYPTLTISKYLPDFWDGIPFFFLRQIFATATHTQYGQKKKRLASLGNIVAAPTVGKEWPLQRQSQIKPETELGPTALSVALVW